MLNWIDFVHTVIFVCAIFTFIAFYTNCIWEIEIIWLNFSQSSQKCRIVLVRLRHFIGRYRFSNLNWSFVSKRKFICFYILQSKLYCTQKYFYSNVHKSCPVLCFLFSSLLFGIWAFFLLFWNFRKCFLLGKN